MNTQEHVDQIAAGARGPWHPDAFNCEHCPGTGCPAWWREQWERTDADGVTREKITEGCGFRLVQAMFVRSLVGTHTVEGILEQRTNEIAQKQDEQNEGIKATLKMLLVLAARGSGNPAAVALAPLIPRVLGAARKLLPARKQSKGRAK